MSEHFLPAEPGYVFVRYIFPGPDKELTFDPANDFERFPIVGWRVDPMMWTIPVTVHRAERWESTVGAVVFPDGKAMDSHVCSLHPSLMDWMQSQCRERAKEEQVEAKQYEKKLAKMEAAQ